MPTDRRPIAVPPIDPARAALTKIVATIGPATGTADAVRRLIEAGVSVFRLNFSHGDLGTHTERLEIIREVARDSGSPVGILGDLGGPKIRIGHLPAPMELAPGHEVLIARDADQADVLGDGGVIVLPTTYPALIDEVAPGQRVLINDGAVRMLAVERGEGGPVPGPFLRCRVTVGGPVTTGKGINLPDSDLGAPAITERDWECVAWAVRHGVDFLALSFVRRPEEVRELKRHLEGVCSVDRTEEEHDHGARIPVIAKIEMPQALLHIDGIIEAADAVMVARGDLGVEMDLSQVPVVQKQLIAKCADWGKPCIVATQMLESMIQSPSPTRAEASDVANAIFDSADAVMLSGETAVGKHAALAVETMRRIIVAAETYMDELPHAPSPPAELQRTRYRTAALAHGAFAIAKDVGACLVVCWSQHGGTARYLSQNNFRVPIVAYSSDERTTRRMTLLFGVRPILARPPRSGRLAEWVARVDADLLNRGWARPGDQIILLAGRPLGEARSTDTIAVHAVGAPIPGEGVDA